MQTAERAQETLNVTVSELQRLGEGIQQSELDRLKARIKSALIMQQESTSARSGALARDWYHLGRARSLDEVGQLVDALSAETINRFLKANPPRDLLVVMPAFMVTELGEAFQIGFLVFVPFLVIDMVVANVLLALGMHMLSPTTVSMPFKLLLFVMVDGFYLLARALVLGYV